MNANTPSTYFTEIPLEALDLNDYNARRFEENMTPQRRARLTELADSIHRKGILEPLLVRPVADGRYEIIAGERRYRAATQVAAENELPANSWLVPCMVRDVDDDEAFDIMVIENLQREDLTPFETAQSFKAYLDRHGNSADAVTNLSSRTGIPVHAIRRQVRLFDLPNAVVAAWKEGTITQSHAELFTRIGNDDQVHELLSACLRSKLTVRELAERIGTIVPDLERGFFDKGECQECHYNTSVQSGLFADIAPAGKCGNPVCFEAKQSAFMIDRWADGKAAKTYGTRGFRFSHRLPQEHREVPPATETAPRCLECDAFVSVIRLAGTVVGCYERTCVGPKACFDELYLAPASTSQVEQLAEPAAAPETEQPETVTEPAKSETETSKTETKTSKTLPPEETGPVYSASRGEKFREIFYRTAIPVTIEQASEGNPFVLRLQLLAMALGSVAVRKHLAGSLGIDDTTSANLAKKLFTIPAADIAKEIRQATVAQLLDATVPHQVRQLVAGQLDIDLAGEWRLTREYLESLTVSEIVRIGEEDGVNLWRDDQIVAYRQEHHKGKALRSLKKPDLINMIFNSNVDLTGRVPAEIIGNKKG